VRDLGADIAALEAWGADAVVSLIEALEAPSLGVPDFMERMQGANFDWHHVPIADFGTPDPATWSAWSAARARLEEHLRGHGRVIVHCAAGIGRTGTLAARLLADLGIDPEAAIEQVRAVRPGAIETAEQAAFVRFGPRLL
jgi:ADP-ribosyl-[dinitrogen reductase] hydrolase